MNYAMTYSFNPSGACPDSSVVDDFGIWNFIFRHIFGNCGLFVTSQSDVVEETIVPGENHCLTQSHWQHSHIPRPGLEPR